MKVLSNQDFKEVLREQREYQKDLSKDPDYVELRNEFKDLCEKYVSQRTSSSQSSPGLRSVPQSGAGGGSRVTFKKEITRDPYQTNIPSGRQQQQQQYHQQQHQHRTHNQLNSSATQPR